MQCPFYWSDDCSLKGTKLWWFCQHGQGCPNNQNASTSLKTKMELWRRCQEGRRRPPCRVTNDPWLVMRPLLQQEGQSQEKSWDWTVTEQNPVWTPIQCRISTGQARNKQTNKPLLLLHRGDRVRKSLRIWFLNPNPMQNIHRANCQARNIQSNKQTTSSATGEAEPGKVLLLNRHGEEPSFQSAPWTIDHGMVCPIYHMITKADKLPRKKYRLKQHVKIGPTCYKVHPGCRFCGTKVATVFCQIYIS